MLSKQSILSIQYSALTKINVNDVQVQGGQQLNANNNRLNFIFQILFQKRHTEMKINLQIVFFLSLFSFRATHIHRKWPKTK